MNSLPGEGFGFPPSNQFTVSLFINIIFYQIFYYCQPFYSVSTTSMDWVSIFFFRMNYDSGISSLHSGGFLKISRLLQGRSFFQSPSSHNTGPIQSLSRDVRLSLYHRMQFFRGLSLSLRSHDQFTGLSLLHGRSASTIELKRQGRRASTN